MNTQRSTVVGVFHDRLQAQRAVDELRRAGFEDAHIGVAARDDETTSRSAAPSVKEEHAAVGLAAGAATGVGVGALWAVGIIAGILPAIGPVILGGGLFAAILASAAGVGAVGGLVGILVGLGIPEEDARYYEGEFKSGKTLVTVRAESRAPEAWAILSRNGAYDRAMAQTMTSSHNTMDVPVAREEVIGERRTTSNPSSSDLR